MSKKGTRTRYPGVTRISSTTYRLRGRVRDPKTGAPIDLDQVVSAASPADAATERARLIADIDKPRVRAQERMTLRAYAKSWYASKLPTLKKATRELYQGILDNDVLPTLGDYLVDAITLDDLIAWRDAQAAIVITTANPSPGKPPLERRISPVTVNGRIRVLKSVLVDAVEDLGLERDPTRRLGFLRKPRPDKNCLDAYELRRVLEAAQTRHPHWYPLFYVLAFTGMRFGEATALRWEDVDERGGEIRIERAQWKGTVDTTKTGSVRTVPLSGELIAVLRQHREVQRAALRRRLKRARVAPIDADQAEEPLVFPGRVGQLMHNTAPRKALLACLAEAGVEGRFTIHGFRRTFNNLMRQAAQDAIVLRSMTGHTTEAMTAHYSHVDTAEKQRALAGMLRLVGTVGGQ